MEQQRTALLGDSRPCDTYMHACIHAYIRDIPVHTSITSHVEDDCHRTHEAPLPTKKDCTNRNRIAISTNTGRVRYYVHTSSIEAMMVLCVCVVCALSLLNDDGERFTKHATFFIVVVVVANELASGSCSWISSMGVVKP